MKIRTNQDEIEQRGLINLDEISIPSLKLILGGFLIGIRSLDVLLAILDHLSQDLAGDVGKRDAAVGAVVLNHMLDRL